MKVHKENKEFRFSKSELLQVFDFDYPLETVIYSFLVHPT